MFDIKKATKKRGDLGTLKAGCELKTSKRGGGATDLGATPYLSNPAFQTVVKTLNPSLNQATTSYIHVLKKHKILQLLSKQGYLQAGAAFWQELKQ